jgi:tRNA (guanine-N7-)-methyltransferase
VSRKKKKRFEDIETFNNVFDRSQILGNSGWWMDFYPNNRVLTLELGCGKGDLIVEMARRYPKRNFLGIDRKGDRIWKGAKVAVEEGLLNVSFLKARIEDLPDYFGRNIAEEIWITFPDPMPKRRQIKHRLLAPKFLEMYRELLVSGGFIHLKTDDLQLFRYTEGIVKETRAAIHFSELDLYNSSLPRQELGISTDFERRHLEDGKTIKYLCFGFSKKD